MPKQKHTSGPWRVSGGKIIADPFEIVASVNEARDEWRYNAQLISTAPDMLKALCECEVLLDQYPTVKRMVKDVIREATEIETEG